MKAKVGRNRRGATTVLRARASKPARWREPALERLGLDHPRGLRERVLARLVAHALNCAKA